MADNTAKRYLDLEGLKTFYDLLVKKFADKSELVTLKDSLKNYITTVDAQKLVKAEISKEIAKVVDGAPDTFDTLKEIANWIENHPNLDEALGSEIDTLREEIETLNTSVGTLQSDLNGFTDRVSNVETKASDNATEIEGLKSSLEGKADADALSALDERVQAVEGNLGDKNVIEGIKLNGTLVEPNEDKIVELTVEGGSAGTISMTTTQSLGGIPVGTVYDNASIAKVLEDLLAPYVAFKGLTISAKYDSFPISYIQGKG